MIPLSANIVAVYGARVNQNALHMAGWPAASPRYGGGGRATGISRPVRMAVEGHDMTSPLTGHCLCGRISYRAEAAPLWQMHCHCESCRCATASGFTSFFAIADGSWRWIGAEPALFRSAPGVTRRICAACGSPMAFRTDAAPGEMPLFAATLERPEVFAPKAHDCSAERLPWVVLCDGLALLSRGPIWFGAAEVGPCGRMPLH
jgi:hypothetical protein